MNLEAVLPRRFSGSAVCRVFGNAQVVDHLAPFLDISSEYPLSRAVPFRLSIWKFPMSSLENSSLQQPVFDTKTQNRNLWKTWKISKTRFIPLRSVVNLSALPQNMSKRFLESMFMEFSGDKILSLCLFPFARFPPGSEKRKCDEYCCALTFQALKPNLSQLLRFSENCLASFQTHLNNGICTLTCHRFHTTPAEENGQVEESVTYWYWKEFSFMQLGHWNTMCIEDMIWDKRNTWIVPVQELVWRIGYIPLAQKLLNLSGKEIKQVVSADPKFPKIIDYLPHWYKVVTEILTLSPRTPLLAEDEAGWSWLFECRFYYPLRKFLSGATLNYDVKAGQNSGIVNAWFAAMGDCAAWQIGVAVFEKLGIKVNFKAWDVVLLSPDNVLT